MTRRRLSDDERTLWHEVARSIAPLRKRARRDPQSDASVTAPPPKQRAKATQSPAASPGKPRTPPPAPQPPPLAPLDRRVKRRLARGAESIDARLDLHGLTQAEAHNALIGFLHAAQARGCRLVLVITGKGGSDAGSGRGVLKRQVPMWLQLPELRPVVVGFETAAVAHGGEGAIYVRVRQRRGER